MSTHFDVNHLVTDWHLWVSDQFDIDVPSLRHPEPGMGRGRGNAQGRL